MEEVRGGAPTRKGGGGIDCCFDLM
jgi:hypothetical protein